MKKNFTTFAILALLTISSSCSGPNPNPGERTADIAWQEYKYERAHEIIKREAEKGLPWAQLRLGVMYELGVGVKKDTAQAIIWYEKTAAQKSKGGWAEGMIIGAIGRSGYFNQNSDARIAQFQLAGIYNKQGGKENLIKAYFNIRNVVEETKGQNIFYCCEFAGGRSITSKQISSLYEEILSKMSDKDKKFASDLYEKSKLKK